MKYLVLFSSLLLMGAGCAQQTSVTSESSTTTQTSPAADSSAEASATAEELQEIVAGDEEAPKAEEEPSIITEPVPSEENEVPVTEVELGSAEQAIEVEIGNFYIQPNVINTTAGQSIKVTFGKVTGFHTFVLEEAGVSVDAVTGNNVIFTAPTTPGSYTYYCDVGSHKANGLFGTLVVK